MTKARARAAAIASSLLLASLCATALAYPPSTPGLVLPSSLQLKCVVLDGSTPATQKQAAQEIDLPAGSSAQLNFAAVNAAGAAVDLSSASVVLTVKKSASDQTPLISRQATVGAPITGVGYFPLSVADTLSMRGAYAYEVTITWGDGSRNQVVPLSTWMVMTALAAPGQAVTAPAAQAPLGIGPPGTNWRGTYNGATTYAVNDAVSYTDTSTGAVSSYRCISATTGNAPSNAVYWALMAQGQGITGVFQSPPGTPLLPSGVVTVDGTLLRAARNNSTGATDITAPGLVALAGSYADPTFIASLSGAKLLSGTVPASALDVATQARLPPTPSANGNFVVDNGSGYTSRTITVPDLPSSTCVPATKFSGADLGARISSAVAAFGTTGGCVDATALFGAQTISSTVTVDRPVAIKIGAAQFTCSASPCFNVTAGTSKAANFRIEGFDAYSSSITAASGGKIFNVTGDFFNNVGDGRQQITIRNLALLGNGASSAFTASPGFPTTNFQDGQILIIDSAIVGHGGIAVNIGNSVYHVRVFRNYFKGNQQALWIDNNAESTVSENWFIQGAGGGDQVTYIGPMALFDHNYFYRAIIADTANSSDLRLMPVAAWPSQSGGYVWITNNRFGSERENFDPTRRRIRLRSDDTADPSHNVIGGPVILRGNRFLGPSSGATCAASGATTATVTLSAGHTTQGLSAGNNIVVTSAADQHFNGRWVIASVTDSTHLTFTLPATLTASGSCVVFSGDLAPIEQDNPHLQWSVNDNYFSGYRYLDDDEQPTPSSSNVYGMSRWGNNDSADNDVNQTMPGFQVFKNGGKLFSLVTPLADSPDPVVDSVARQREARKLENRLFRTESLDVWAQSNGITTTGGQTDHLGGTRAFLLTNSGTTPSSQHISQQFDKSGMTTGQRVMVKFWAKAGTTNTVTVGVFDSANGSFEGNLDKFTLGADWKQYVLWTNDIKTANTYSLLIYPGDTTWLNGSIYIVEPQVSTFSCDYLPNASGSVMAQDTAAGSRFEQAILASVIKADPLTNLLNIIGAVSVASQWTFTTAPAFQQNGIGTTPTPGMSSQNTTAATASVTQQASPLLEMVAHRWNTTTLADETTACGWMLNPLPGATGSIYARVQWECKAPGGSYSATGTYIDSSGDLFVQGSSTLNGSVQFQSAQKHHGRTVADINTTAATSDHYIGYTSLTAPRTVTVNPALIGATSSEFWPLIVKDESGNASATNTITVTLSSGAWDGGASASYTCISSGGGFCAFYCDGTNCHHMGADRPVTVSVSSPLGITNAFAGPGGTIGPLTCATCVATSGSYADPSWITSLSPTKVAVFGGASAGAGGTQGTVPAPSSGQQAAFLRGDATWATPPGTGTVTSITCDSTMTCTPNPITSTGTHGLNLANANAWTAIQQLPVGTSSTSRPPMLPLVTSTAATTSSNVGNVDVADYPLPANALSSDGMGLEWEANYTRTTGNTDNDQVTTNFNGTTAGSISTTGSTASGFTIKCTLIRTSSSTATVRCYGTVLGVNTFTMSRTLLTSLNFASVIHLKQTLIQTTTNGHTAGDGLLVKWFSN